MEVDLNLLFALTLPLFFLLTAVKKMQTGVLEKRTEQGHRVSQKASSSRGSCVSVIH